MKKLLLLISTLVYSVIIHQANCQANENYYLPVNQLHVSLNNATKPLSIVYYSNFDKRWAFRNSTYFYFVDDLSKGLILDSKLNKSAIIFTGNETLSEIFINEGTSFNVN
jgi:hypothetical protein